MRTEVDATGQCLQPWIVLLLTSESADTTRDGVIGLQPGATKQDLLRAIKGIFVAEAQLIATYAR
jgi:hypothetical protein